MTTDTVDVSSTLLDAVVDKLKNKSENDLMQIWRHSGIPYFWLRKVVNGDIQNPGVKRIQYLYEYLTERKLDV